MGAVGASSTKVFESVVQAPIIFGDIWLRKVGTPSQEGFFLTFRQALPLGIQISLSHP